MVEVTIEQLTEQFGEQMAQDMIDGLKLRDNMITTKATQLYKASLRHHNLKQYEEIVLADDELKAKVRPFDRTSEDFIEQASQSLKK